MQPLSRKPPLVQRAAVGGEGELWGDHGFVGIVGLCGCGHCCCVFRGLFCCGRRRVGRRDGWDSRGCCEVAAAGEGDGVVLAARVACVGGERGHGTEDEGSGDDDFVLVLGPVGLGVENERDGTT